MSQPGNPQKCILKGKPGESGVEVEAQFNPKELQLDKTVPWAKHATKGQDLPALEFTNAEPRNLAVELLFDTYEAGQAVTGTLDRLEQLTKIVPSLGRPPGVIFVWGSFRFEGAIESLSVKYTMFLHSGAPCRAVVNVKIKEAKSLREARNEEAEGENAAAAGQSDGAERASYAEGDGGGGPPTQMLGGGGSGGLGGGIGGLGGGGALGGALGNVRNAVGNVRGAVDNVTGAVSGVRDAVRDPVGTVTSAIPGGLPIPGGPRRGGGG